MPSLSPLELLVVAAVALIVFGPQKLPGIVRSIGKTLGELRRMASDVKSEFDTGMSIDEDEPAPAKDRAEALEVTDEDDES